MSGPCVVDHRNLRATRLDQAGLWEPPPQLFGVDVAVDGGNRRTERLDLLQHLGVGEVARVQNQVGFPQGFDACIGDAASTAW